MRIETKSSTNIILFIKISTIVVLMTFSGTSKVAFSQQSIVDDAAVTTQRSFQLESWYGAFESELVPAVALTSRLEAGAAFVFDSKDNFSFTGYSLEVKAVSADFEETGSAFGLFAGFGFDESSSFEELITYIPYSRVILNDSSALHLNLGLSLVDAGDDWEAGVIYGVRTDIALHERFTLLTEVFAENDTFGFQAGGRVGIVPGLLEMDIMYGRGFDSYAEFPGFTLGLAFTPDAVW